MTNKPVIDLTPEEKPDPYLQADYEALEKVNDELRETIKGMKTRLATLDSGTVQGERTIRDLRLMVVRIASEVRAAAESSSESVVAERLQAANALLPMWAADLAETLSSESGDGFVLPIEL